MGKICLDTNICIEFLRNQQSWLASQQTHNFAISAITIYELQLGAKTPEQQKLTDLFIQNFDILPLDTQALKLAAILKQDLQKRGKIVELRDIFIASTVISHRYALKTYNKKDFKHIGGLVLI
jgi:tRNA(fMet)-specific endonuclease VapC